MTDMRATEGDGEFELRPEMVDRYAVELPGGLSVILDRAAEIDTLTVWDDVPVERIAELAGCSLEEVIAECRRFGVSCPSSTYTIRVPRCVNEAFGVAK